MAPDDPSDTRRDMGVEHISIPRDAGRHDAGGGEAGRDSSPQGSTRNDRIDAAGSDQRPSDQSPSGRRRTGGGGAGGGAGGRGTGQRGGTQRGGPGAPPPGGSHDEEERRRHTRRQFWYAIGYVVVALFLLYLFQQFILGPMTSPSTQLDYSTFKQDVAAKQIDTAVIGTNQITGTMKSADPKVTTPVDFKVNTQPAADPQLIQELQVAGVKYSFAAPSSPIGGILLAYILPLLLIGFVWYYIYRRAARASGGGGIGGGIFGAGRSKATQVTPEQVGVTFKDVGGADEAIAEL